MRSLCEESAAKQPEPEPKAEQDTPFNAARFERENEILMYNMRAKLAEERLNQWH
jgi:hypothetical protein